VIQKKTYSTYKELERDSIENGFTIYGDLDGYGYGNTFESIVVQNKGYICGLAYEHHGINSKVLLLGDMSKLLIGFEQTIIVLDCDTKIKLIQKDSSSLFDDFIETESYILAIFEINIYVFDRGYNFIWFSYFRDVIEDYKVLNGDKVVIWCSNGDKSFFDLKEESLSVKAP